MASNKPPRQTRPDLLAIVETCGQSERAVETAVPLAQGFLAKAKKGGNASGKAAPAWARLEGWLEARGLMTKPGTSAAQAGEAEEARKGLALAIDKARTSRQLRDVAKRISLLMLGGALDRGDATALIDCVKEARSCHRAAREEANVAQLNALEVLSPDEQEMLSRFRRLVAGPPLAPGQYVEPPPEKDAPPVPPQRFYVLEIRAEQLPAVEAVLGKLEPVEAKVVTREG